MTLSATRYRYWLVILLLCLWTSQVFGQVPDRTSPGASPPPAAEQILTLPETEKNTTGNRGSVRFIGTATVLINHAGFTILTDPNFLHKGGQVHLGYGLTSERLTEPALTLDQLPPIDLVVLSHFHGDHFDQLVQEKFNRNVPIVSTPEAAAKLGELGFKTRYGLKTWDSLVVKKGNATLRISAMPGKHGPPVVERLLPDVMGSILEFSVPGQQALYRMYISGDTMVYDDIRQIPKRFPDIDLAILHLGGTRILGVVKVTMDGADGIRMLDLIAPRHAIPIHFNDYDVFKSPLGDFEREVKASQWQGKVTYLKHGDTYQFEPAKR